MNNPPARSSNASSYLSFSALPRLFSSSANPALATLATAGHIAIGDDERASGEAAPATKRALWGEK